MFAKLFIFLLAFFLVHCSSDDQSLTVNTGKYAPQLNPHPKYFMTVKGKIDPALQGKIKLVWQASYATNNAHCQKVINSWEGVYAPREKKFFYNTVPDQQGNYQMKIPLDGLESGYCQWKINTIGYKLKTKNDIYFNEYPQIFFSDRFNESEDIVSKEDWICAQKNCDYFPIKYFTKNGAPLNRNKNYFYKIDIKSQKD